MRRIAAQLGKAVMFAAATVVAMSMSTPSAVASSSSVPFNDASIHGTLTFCSRTGQPMTSGSLTTAPFAWKTVSSVPAPAGYQNQDSRATLYAYQPIQFVDPGDWSGEQLTGSSSYTNVDHPVDQATNADQPLLGFTQAYPAHWQGLIEIRMFFSRVNYPAYTTTYPAAILRISANSWTMVQGGGSSCGLGQGKSDESKLLPKKVLKKQQQVIPAGDSSTAPSTTASSGSGGGSSNGSNSGSAGAGSGAGSAAAGNSSSSSGLSMAAKTGIALAVIAVIGLLMAVVGWRRRRPSGSA
jgi:hypothetical protein